MTIGQSLQIAMDHHRAGRLRQAELIYRAIVGRVPEHPVALHMLGAIALQVGRNDRAVELINKAISLSPNDATCHSNLGLALAQLGNFGQAIVSYARAIQLKPDFADAFDHLGNALREQLQFDAALASFSRAIELAPGHADAHSNLGITLKDVGRLDEAMASFRRAMALQPGNPRFHSNLLYTLQFDPASDARAIRDEHQRFDQLHSASLISERRQHACDLSPDRRLRIGYVSPCFHEHSESFFTVPLLREHDRDRVEVFCYSDASREDAVTTLLQRNSTWRPIGYKSDQRVAEMIGEDRIDILVDLTMHMAGGRPLLFARKPAPVQVAWLAYPGTTGLSAMDYRLTDPYLDPPGSDDHYCEQSVRLPDTVLCYDPNWHQNIAESECRELDTNRGATVTFGSFNNFCKVNDGVLQMWAAALKTTAHSRLLLLAPEGSCRVATLQKMAGLGVDAARIEFVSRLPRSAYLQLHRRVDIILDTYPYNGETTTFDALWMGVPVVSLCGPRAASRAGYCYLRQLGLTDLVASSATQFAEIAARLAMDQPRLRHLRRTLRHTLERSPLMDAGRFARNVEQAYRAMWHRYCAGS